MTTTNPFDAALEGFPNKIGEGAEAYRKFPHMPVGQAVDMGHDENGIPLFDPRIFDSGEFARNPYPYYRICLLYTSDAADE